MSHYNNAYRENLVKVFLRQYHKNNDLTASYFAKTILGGCDWKEFLQWLLQYDLDREYPLILDKTLQYEKKAKRRNPIESPKGKIVFIEDSTDTQVQESDATSRNQIIIETHGMRIVLDGQASKEEIKEVLLASKEVN